MRPLRVGNQDLARVFAALQVPKGSDRLIERIALANDGLQAVSDIALSRSSNIRLLPLIIAFGRMFFQKSSACLVAL